MWLNLLVALQGTIPSLIRWAAGLGLSALATRGWIDGDTVTAGVAFATGLGVALVSVLANGTRARVANVVSMPGVNRIELAGREDTGPSAYPLHKPEDVSPAVADYVKHGI